ncbi:hypothetical protein HYT57_00650 [Candidatus Woesearchaeota archaeon]|nr:hypothetical protein [Candidatus Woesearchaeota archaeon]
MIRIEINGEEPYLYSSERLDKFDSKAYANRYTLVTGDSFEVGSAYSLHITARDAQKYLPRDWWRAVCRAIPVFVSKTSLETIVKQEDKCIFVSSEN